MSVPHRTSTPLANSGLKLETISACLSLFLSLARLPSLPAVHAALVRLRSACLSPRGRAFCSTTKRPRLQSEQLVKELGQENCAAMACNLSGTETAQELVAAAVKRFGRLDILVANHGVWPPRGRAHRQDVGRAMAQHHGHQSRQRLRSGQTLRGADEEAGKIGQAPPGTSSWSVPPPAQRGEAFHCDYAATKGALISMVKGLSTELARDAIYVNSVAPGWVDTDMSASGAERSRDQHTHLCRRSRWAGWPRRRRLPGLSFFCARSIPASSPARYST